MSQMEEFNPDIEMKYDHLIRHMDEKNSVISQFVRILKQICDAEIFYSRSLDKFANNISKLMVGKDPLKEVLIIFERVVGAKSEQSMELANSIKDDMIPFIEKEGIDLKEQGELRGKQKLVKDMRSNMQRKLKNLHSSEGSYKRAYDMLKKYSQVETRLDLQQKEKAQRIFNERQAGLIETINSYNHTVQEYMLNYTALCEKLSDIETKRKLNVRDAINKFMIFEISCIKNIEYNIPRYMKSLEGMSDRLVIQDKIGGSNIMEGGDRVVNLAKISISNYICNLNDREKVDIPSVHKRILEIKKNTENVVSVTKYHQIVQELYKLLDQTIIDHDIRVLKEIVYFTRSVYCLVTFSPAQMGSEGGGDLDLKQKNNKSVAMLLLDAIMCHRIFQSTDFWSKYEQRLFDIIQRESNQVLDSQTQQIQISLNFLAPDIEFLRIVRYHPLPFSILSKFTIIQEQKPVLNESRKVQNPKDNVLQQYIKRNGQYL